MYLRIVDYIMPMKLGLISCTKLKKHYRCKAKEMYSPSPLFSKAYEYSKNRYDKVGILSAKYHLIFPNDEIDTYDLTLNTMSKEERKEWSRTVFEQLKNKVGLENIDEVYLHAGEKYREFLIPLLEGAGIKCHVPLEGLKQGQQLNWYNYKLKNARY